MEYEADPKHAAVPVNKNLTGKDRPASTMGEEMNDIQN